VPDPLQLLLDVQARDLVADQLRHRRASLPERLARAEQEAALARLDTELAELQERFLEVQRSQKRIEDEVASLQSKAEAENRKLYSGTVTSPRELQAMQEEIDGLTRRQRGLEDDVLALMETAEPLADEVDRLSARRGELEAEAARLAAAIAEAEAAIDAELAGVVADRDGIAAGVPADLLATYEKLRAHLDGVGVAHLEGTQCSGCHLSLPATEVAAVRKATPGAVVYHEECGRILVP
jgi:predicted  nucleic acid-binding Zn-ribbon protein